MRLLDFRLVAGERQSRAIFVLRVIKAVLLLQKNRDVVVRGCQIRAQPDGCNEMLRRKLRLSALHQSNAEIIFREAVVFGYFERVREECVAVVPVADLLDGHGGEWREREKKKGDGNLFLPMLFGRQVSD